MLKEKKKNFEGWQDPDNLNLKTNPKMMTNFSRKKCLGKITEYFVPSFMGNLQIHSD